jgi:hypothetical protein
MTDGIGSLRSLYSLGILLHALENPKSYTRADVGIITMVVDIGIRLFIIVLVADNSFVAAKRALIGQTGGRGSSGPLRVSTITKVSEKGL